MFGLIIMLVLIWQVYKAANEGGRNGILWAIIAFIGSVVMQVGIGMVFGIIIGVGIEVGGWSEDLFNILSWPISLFAMIANGFALWLLIKYLSRVRYDEVYTPPPPPPPTFN